VAGTDGMLDGDRRTDVNEESARSGLGGRAVVDGIRVETDEF
jgi:hypothetical protein